MSNKKYYAVYLNSTDEIVVSGTAQECAKKMNKSLNCFYSLVSKSNLGRQNKYSVYSEDLDNIDTDDEKTEV